MFNVLNLTATGDSGSGGEGESGFTFYHEKIEKKRTEREFFRSDGASILTVFGMFAFFHVRFFFEMKNNFLNKTS